MEHIRKQSLTLKLFREGCEGVLQPLLFYASVWTEQHVILHYSVILKAFQHLRKIINMQKTIQEMRPT